MSIIISVNNNGGTIWKDNGDICHFVEYLSDDILQSILLREEISKQVENNNRLFIKKDIFSYVAIGKDRIEGCSYNPEYYYFDIIEESTGDTIGIALNNLEAKLKTKKNQKVKRKVLRDFNSPIIKNT